MVNAYVSLDGLSYLNAVRGEDCQFSTDGATIRDGRFAGFFFHPGTGTLRAVVFPLDGGAWVVCPLTSVTMYRKNEGGEKWIPRFKENR